MPAQSGSRMSQMIESNDENIRTSEHQLCKQTDYKPVLVYIFNLHPCGDQQGNHTAADNSQRYERQADISQPAHTMSMA